MPEDALTVEVFKAVRAPVTAPFMRSVLVAAASVAGLSGSLSVRLTGDGELRRLNLSFLGEDRPTDVLSFPSGGSGEGGPGYLGDLAVSWPAVQRQAAAYGHPASTELALLLVHGLLHLAGLDHGDAQGEAAMTALTLRCLAASGLAPSLAPARLKVDL